MPRKNPEISKEQILLSWAILAVLAGIAVGVYLEQFRLNPAVMAFRAPTSMQRPSESLGGTSSTETLFPTPPGMVPFSPVEVFNPDTLSDKIDGKADFYLSAGFRALESQRIKREDGSGSWMEISIYDMGSEANAYAVYSAQKREDAEPAEVAPFSYGTKNALFFVHGPYYVEVISSEPGEKAFHAMTTLARSYMENTRAEAEAIPEIALFPPENRTEGDIVLLTADVFGCECLDQVFTADYRSGDLQATAFLSRRDSQGEARRLALEFHDFLTAYGGKDVAYTGPLPEAKMVELFGAYELIFVRGPFLAGVHEATGRGIAQDLAGALDQRLSEFVGGNRSDPQ